MKHIGIEQLVLETDLEDANRVWDDLIQGAEGVADALDADVLDVMRVTNENALNLYFGEN